MTATTSGGSRASERAQGALREAILRGELAAGARLGEVELAEQVYAQDLGFDPTTPRSSHHPNNVWALHGYHEALVRLGKTEQATVISQQLELARGRADVPIEASCLCRLIEPQPAGEFSVQLHPGRA